ncbi:hypothetical protein Bca4012_017738 [Brassica carinata]
MESYLGRQAVHLQPQGDVSIHPCNEIKDLFGIDPKIVVRELSLDIPGLEAQKPKKLVSCGEFMICSMGKGAAVCNPWLKQSTWINSEPSLNFYGICHRDSNNRSEESVYKTVWGKGREWKIHDLASGTWIDIRSKSSDSNQGEKKYAMHSTSGVFLNGTLFWIAFDETAFLYCLLSDFSTEGFYIYCELPCGRSHPSDVLVFNAFKGDRLSVLKQCHTTKKIEIWVTENKVEKGAGVVWINFMTFSIPNFPGLVTSYLLKPSYFIDSNERLVLCSCDETGKAWIYVMGGNKLIRKVHLDSVVDPWPLHCTYFPSLVPVPRSQRDVAESEV